MLKTEKQTSLKVIAIITVLAIVVIDQISKILIKTNFMLGEEINIFGNWFILHFTENDGMAFGISFGGVIGKYILTIFRIAAVSGIIWYLTKLFKRGNISTGLAIGISAILAGAIGNILDSLFYGVIFSSSHWQIAEFMPTDGGYSTWLQGHVVDMFYFPIIDTHLPSWFPFWANKHIVFFRPIFNIADTAVSCGVFYLIIFQRKFFKTEMNDKK